MKQTGYSSIFLLLISLSSFWPVPYLAAAVLADKDKAVRKKAGDTATSLSVRRLINKTMNEENDEELLNTYISINQIKKKTQADNTRGQRLAQIMERAARLETSTPETLLEFAKDYLEAGEPELAAASAWIATRKDPANPDHLFFFAYTLEKCADYENARTLFEWAYRMDASMVAIERHLGNIDFYTQQFENAKRHYLRALDSGDDSTFIRQRLRNIRAVLNSPENENTLLKE